MTCNNGRILNFYLWLPPHVKRESFIDQGPTEEIAEIARIYNISQIYVILQISHILYPPYPGIIFLLRYEPKKIIYNNNNNLEDPDFDPRRTPLPQSAQSCKSCKSAQSLTGLAEFDTMRVFPFQA